jgi:predicted CoA-binding protein
MTSDERMRQIFETSRTVAVLGAHDDPPRPAFYVPDYLSRRGYRVLAVNPALAGQMLWGNLVKGSLAALGEPVDVVDVFRRSDLLPQHLQDILAASPKVVWMQPGTVNEDVVAALRAAKIEVVDHGCMLADHRRLFG